MIRQHAVSTLQEENGCFQFDGLLPQEDGNPILLYEVYRGDATFQVHRQSARLASTRATYADMIEDRTITLCTVG